MIGPLASALCGLLLLAEPPAPPTAPSTATAPAPAASDDDELLRNLELVEQLELLERFELLVPDGEEKKEPQPPAPP